MNNCFLTLNVHKYIAHIWLKNCWTVHTLQRLSVASNITHLLSFCRAFCQCSSWQLPLQKKTHSPCKSSHKDITRWSHDVSHDACTDNTWWLLCCLCPHCTWQHKDQGPRTQTLSPSWRWSTEVHWQGMAHLCDPVSRRKQKSKWRVRIPDTHIISTSVQANILHTPQCNANIKKRVLNKPMLDPCWTSCRKWHF